MESLNADLFKPVSTSFSQAEVISRPPVSFWGDVWRRFLQNKLALIGLVVIVLLVLMSLVGPIVSPHDYRTQDYSAMNAQPSAEYWFGTDHLGRDLFARLWYGGRISLFIAVMATLIDMVIGVIWGAIAGYAGGRVDDVMMRIVDILYGVPYLLMVILLSMVLGQGLVSIILAMGLSGWVGMARLVRGQVLQLKEQEFVLAARVLGASPARVIMGHLIPNTMGVILVNLTLTIPERIFGEAFLSFIGLGVPQPMPSWGIMVRETYDVFRVHPEQLLFPALAICLTMFAFNIVGDALRDALDPRLRQ